MLRIVRSYKYLLLILSLSLAISLVRGQGGSSPVIINDSVMMIGPDVESLTEEQIYFNPTYLVVDPTKGHLRDQLIRACVCDCDTSVPNRRIGIFSVAKGKKVSFSQGSLQYLPAANLWKFADAQYEYLHNSNKYNSPIYRNWVDLFDWRGVAGVSFDDWGKNAICGDTSQTWRTLSADEWKYLLHDRKHATELLLPAMVENTLGLVVLPDDWVCPEGVTLVTLSQTNVTWDEAQRVYTYSSNIYLSNVFSLTSWQRMEEAGAVFMPASGYINKDGVLNACGTVGRYWSSSPNKNTKGYYMSFGLAPTSATHSIRTQSDVNADKGHTVRLVHDTIMPLPLPCETFEVTGVTFNMMCVEGETYDYLIGETEVTRALWKAVMGNLPSSYAASNAPIDNVSWGECQQFIQKLNQLTGQHFRFPTKAEWLYAAKGGKNNEGFLYSGSDNIDEVGWYRGNSVGGGQPVATLKPNDLGIYDMTGNVWEWVAKTGKNTYPYMGGSYAFNAEKCLLSKASGVASEANHKGSIGLRLVLDKHTYVDLGLSVMWATTNVGAESAEEFGDYFAWGETEPKEVYDWSTYKWCDGTANKMTKYNATDGLTTLLPEDDAAHVNWGGEWRMASDAEWTELREQCDWKWTTINGTKGYTVTGPNGNSIFLSAAGFYYASGLSYVNNHGDYWSGTRNSTSASGACHVYFTSDLLIRSSSWRYYGFPVRPVLPADREILAPATPGKRIGVFSVAADKQVTFSQGNLQYTQSTDTWQFANEQWECIGSGNIKEGALADKIDLFGWSANNTTAPWGVSLSGNNADYAGEFVDWGENIINSDVPNTWRTLTNAEWEYVLNGRDNASQLRCRAQVDHVNGFVFLPDDWVCPDGIELNLEQPTIKVFTRDEWRKMENAGAVFLPSAGRIDNKKLVNFDDHGNYWSSTRINNNYVDYLAFTFSSNKLYVDHQLPIYLGRSVRLVRDTILPLPEYVDLGLSVKWATFNVGATKPEDYGDYFAWGETETKETYSWATYKWGTSSKLTKYNATDGKTVLDLDDDAAYVHWGGNWRIPSKEEVDELTQQCNWIWTTHNNVNGYKVTGPNGNSIFLPAAGYKGSGPTYPAGEDGLYWTNTTEKQHYSYLIVLHDDAPPTQAGRQGTRCFGFAVRAVYDDRPPKRIGVFSVSADKQVSFSQGNVQYTQSTDEWRFAREQYEYIGAENIKDGKLANRIDLFGWSANNTTAPFGVSTSTNNADYAGEFVDWGTNIIQDDAANTWRTLSKEEWEYLIKGRKNASNLRAAAQVNGVNGMILLPDDWECPEGIDFKAGYHTSKGSEYYAEYQQFTKVQWRELETTGAIFLPAAGMHDGNGIADIQAGGYYWSATENGDTYAYTLISQSSGAYLTYDNRYDVRSVRLVHDTIVPPPAPCQTFEVKGVTFNMMCVEGEMYDYKIAQTEVTQGLWEQVMGYNNSLFKGEYLPVEKVSWEECQTFIQKLNEMTGKHFRLPTEAEWEYAARGGKNSRGYTYAGSNSIDSVAWYQANSQEQTHTIATLMPNELGIYDMSGNVWEWCQDYYDASAQRVVRGGSFYDVASVCRISSRGGRDANYRSYIGLRLVLDEHEYVDLGLSVMWATTNVGAESAEEFGDYFAWGETEPKEVYDWSTYKWCDCTEDNMTKYNATDGLTTLLPEDDAAHVNWGGEWRMASDVEFQELIDNCLFEITNHNGVKGTWVTSKINGNRIFIPYAGYYNHGNGGTADKNYSSQQRLWTSSSIGRATHAKDYCNQAIEGNTRRCGFPIRPVVSAGRDIQIPPTPGKRIGVFSVSADKQVSFSQGNLQYIQSANLWRFAENQYDYIGKGNIASGQLGKTIDMFAWSTDADPANKWGVTIAEEGFDGAFVDWGLNYIHGEVPGPWRTLSLDEWTYLFSGRQRATELWGVAQVEGVSGIIILPDRWNPTDELPFVAGLNKNGFAEQQTLSAEQWQRMEELGAVFLPAAGGRDGAQIASSHIDSVGWYWSSTPTNPDKAGCVRFECNLMAQRDGWRQAGLSVRLVHDTVVPFTPEYVDLGLSVLWATTNVGARYPEGYGDYFAWGETEPKEAYSWDTYKWCNSADTSITKYNNADGMKTLLPEDDAATVNWGGKWRTPTKEELAELRLSCTWEWTTLNGINGHQVTGPNGNSIFIPAGGSYNQFNHEISGVGIQGWFYASDRGAARHANEIGTPAKGPYSGSCSRCCGLTIRPVCEKDSNIVTVIIDPTPANSNVGLYSRYEGSVKVTRSIRVEKGNDVLYQVSNTENGYLSQGDTLYKVMRDTVLKVSLRPFTEGNWETVDLTGLTRYDNYYISRNRGIFAGPYSNWCYYVMPVNSGETYRVSSRAGQLAALWFIASTPPDYENKIPPTKVNCSKNGGIVGYIAEEFTVSGGVSG